MTSNIKVSDEAEKTDYDTKKDDFETNAPMNLGTINSAREDFASTRDMINVSHTVNERPQGSRSSRAHRESSGKKQRPHTSNKKDPSLISELKNSMHRMKDSPLKENGL